MSAASKQARSQVLDENINVLHALLRPGDRLSTKAIAEIVGCRCQAIWETEQKALRKVRARFAKELGYDIEEFLQ